MKTKTEKNKIVSESVFWSRFDSRSEFCPKPKKIKVPAQVLICFTPVTTSMVPLAQQHLTLGGVSI